MAIQTKDIWTARKKRVKPEDITSVKVAFLECLAEGWTITSAVTMAGIVRSTAYAWAERDKLFAAAWSEAEVAGGDWYEDQNRREAAKGNMAAILNGLRMRGRIVDRLDTRNLNLNVDLMELVRLAARGQAQEAK